MTATRPSAIISETLYSTPRQVSVTTPGIVGEPHQAPAGERHRSEENQQAKHDVSDFPTRRPGTDRGDAVRLRGLRAWPPGPAAPRRPRESPERRRPRPVWLAPAPPSPTAACRAGSGSLAKAASAPSRSPRSKARRRSARTSACGSSPAISPTALNLDQAAQMGEETLGDAAGLLRSDGGRGSSARRPRTRPRARGWSARRRRAPSGPRAAPDRRRAPSAPQVPSGRARPRRACRGASRRRSRSAAGLSPAGGFSARAFGLGRKRALELVDRARTDRRRDRPRRGRAASSFATRAASPRISPRAASTSARSVLTSPDRP